MSELSFGGREVHGFALGALGDAASTLACPECSCTSYLLGGALLGAGGVYLTILLVGGYVASGPQRRQPRPEPEPYKKPEPEKKKKK